MGVVCAVVTSAARQDIPAAWNTPQDPVRLYGNVFYVGTRGLSSILITSPAGHILIDGALQQSAPMVAANIRAVGFRLDDVKLILNSHVHYDHAGGIAELQRLSGARVAARQPSVGVLTSGRSGPDDPQYGVLPAIQPVTHVDTIADGDTLRVGDLAITAHATGGHTPGGTSWSWQSCEGARCLNMVYADSLTAISANGFFFTRTTAYPSAIRDFERTFVTLSTMPCDILLTPHPDISDLWGRLARRASGQADALVDTKACAAYAETGRKGLAARIATEAGAQK